MSSETTITYTCDIAECNKEAENKCQQIIVVFTTEQTEGRSIKPDPEIENMDLCDEHYKKYISSLPLWAHGAQGNNTYYFKETK